MVPTAVQVEPTALSDLCWIVNTADCPFKEPLEAFWRSYGITPHSTLLAQELSRRELVAQGLGIGFLEPQDGLGLIDRGLGRRLGNYTLEVPLWVVYRDPTFEADARLLQSYLQARYATLQSLEGHAQSAPNELQVPLASTIIKM